VVRGKWTKSGRGVYHGWVEKKRIAEAEREKFRDMAESELVGLHEETSRLPDQAQRIRGVAAGLGRAPES